MTRHEKHERRRRWKRKCLQAVQVEREKATAPKSEPAKGATGHTLKTCGCGRSYSLAQWQALAFVGLIQPDEGRWAEMRNCACGSTISVRVRLVSCTALVPELAA